MRRVALMALVILVGGIARAEEVTMLLEAEQSPMRHLPFETGADPGASNGHFVWDPPGGEGGGVLEFAITIPQSGQYAVWGRIASADPQSDSFWVMWRPADPPELPEDEAKKNAYYWDLSEGPGWQWQRVHGESNGMRDYRTWTFEAGARTVLQIRRREERVKLDAVFITSNTAATTPEAAGIPAPGEKPGKGK